MNKRECIRILKSALECSDSYAYSEFGGFISFEEELEEAIKKALQVLRGNSKG